jgi:leucyl-tRNA synthetase
VVGVDEPFTNMLTQGMVCKETMRCPTHGYLFPEEVKEGKCVLCSQDVVIGKTEKMSKSLKNVVDPDYLINTYGADTVRVFCLFASPPEKDLEWSDQGVEGGFRFLNRIWRIVADYLEEIKGVKPCDGKNPLEGELKTLRRKTHQTIRKVTADIEERFHFNTAISSVMELVNALYQLPRPAKEDETGLAVVRETVEAVIILLAPIVPHVTEELWAMIGGNGPLIDVPWPDFDHAVASEEKITIVLQINGKVRSRMTVAADEEEEEIKSLALSDERIAGLTEGRKIIKVICVPKKLVNIVVAG